MKGSKHNIQISAIAEKRNNLNNLFTFIPPSLSLLI
jgi:hypothetical protein